MVQLNYDEFAEALSECIVSVWVDNESTFGTFPIESMKSNVPVIGKTPETKPEWISDNGMWVTKEDEMNDMIASYILSWIYNSEVYNDFEEKMKETASRYDKNTFNENVKSIFETIYKNRVEMFNKSINNLKNKEE
jgi:glycosyltransferase involved in cell wall biosynthesis